MRKFIYTVYTSESAGVTEFETEAEAMEFARDRLQYLPDIRVEKREIETDTEWGFPVELSCETIWEGTNENPAEETFDLPYGDQEDELNVEFPESDIINCDGSDDECYGDKAWELPDDSIKEAVDALEENESEVECKICFDLFPKEDCVKTEKGYVCKKCNQELHSHQGTNLDLIDNDPFSLDYEDPRDPEEEEEPEVKEEPVDANEVRKFEAGIEENLEEHINDRLADIESDQEYQGVDNAVVDCKKYTLVAHSEDEKPVDCKLEKPALEEPLAGEKVDAKLYEDVLKEGKGSTLDGHFVNGYKVYTRNRSKGEEYGTTFKKFNKINDAIGYAKNTSKQNGIDTKIVALNEKNSTADLLIFRSGKPIRNDIDKTIKGIKADKKATKFADKGEDGDDSHTEVSAEERAAETSAEDAASEEHAAETSTEESAIEEVSAEEGSDRKTKLDKANKNKKIRKALRNAGISDSEISSDTITTVRKELFGEDLSEEEAKELDKEVEALEEELKVITDFSEYKPWSGAVDTYELIKDADKLDELEAYLEECYPDGITATQINDILWFDGDQVLSYLGLGDTEDEEVDECLKEEVKEVPWTVQWTEDSEPSFIGFAANEDALIDQLVKNRMSDSIGKMTTFDKLDKEMYLEMKKDNELDEDEVAELDKYFGITEDLVEAKKDDELTQADVDEINDWIKDCANANEPLTLDAFWVLGDEADEDTFDALRKVIATQNHRTDYVFLNSDRSKDVHSLTKNYEDLIIDHVELNDDHKHVNIILDDKERFVATAYGDGSNSEVYYIGYDEGEATDKLCDVWNDYTGGDLVDLDIHPVVVKYLGSNIAAFDKLAAEFSTNGKITSWDPSLANIEDWDEWQCRFEYGDEPVEESLKEAKKDDELPVDPEAAKLEVHTMLNDLVADEIEAINGYEEAKKEILDTPIAHKDNILDTIDHVEDEEKEHVDELISATTEIPFDKEEAPAPVVKEPAPVEEPLDQEFPEVEEKLEERVDLAPFDSDVKEGDKIRIIHLEGEDNSYDGKEGTVEHIDDIGQLHGTWGGLAIIPGVDDFDIITEGLTEAKLSDASLKKAIIDRYNNAVNLHYSELAYEDEKMAEEFRDTWYKIVDVEVEPDYYYIEFDHPYTEDDRETLAEYIIDDRFYDLHPGEEKYQYTAGSDYYMSVSRDALNESLKESLDNSKLEKLDAYVKENGLKYEGEYTDEGHGPYYYVDEISYYIEYKNNRYELTMATYHSSEDNNAENPEGHTEELDKVYSSAKELYDDFPQVIEDVYGLYEDEINGVEECLKEETITETAAKPEGDKEKTYNDGLKLAKVYNKPVIYGYTNKSYSGKFFALDDPIICDSVSDEAKKFKQQYKSCGQVYVAYPDRSFVESLKLSEGLDLEDDKPEVFTPEEQEEYNCDEDGESLNGYDTYHHCGWCGDVFTEDEMRYEADFGWLCGRCIDELKSHGGPLTFIENEALKEEAPKDKDLEKEINDVVNSWNTDDKEPENKPEEQHELSDEEKKEIDDLVNSWKPDNEEPESKPEEEPKEETTKTEDEVSNVVKDW